MAASESGDILYMPIATPPVTTAAIILQIFAFLDILSVSRLRCSAIRT